MADDDNFAIVFPHFGDFRMDFRHQRTGGVEKPEMASFRVLPYGFRNAVRRKDQYAAGRNFIEFFDKDGAPVFQPVDDMRVVNDFMTDVNRFAEKGESAFDRFDGAFDPRAKTPWLSQNQFHR